MKKILTLILSISLMFALSACGDKKEGTQNSTVSQTESTAESGDKATKSEPVSVGNTITTDFAEMTIDTAAIADDIKTSIKTGHTTRISGPDSSADKEFIYIRGTIKNTGKTEISMPEIIGSVEIDGYSYKLESIDIIESDGSSTYSLEPLMSYTYTLYTEVPNALVETLSDCAFNFGFDENFKQITHFSDEEYVPAYNYTINITK